MLVPGLEPQVHWAHDYVIVHSTGAQPTGLYQIDYVGHM